MKNRRNIILKSTLLSLLLITLSACQTLHNNTIGLFTGPSSPEQTQAPAQAKKTTSTFQSSTHRTDVMAGETKPTTTIEVEKLHPEKKQKKSLVEIIWAIPKEPVDAYVIKYGYSKESLDHQTTLNVKDIEKYEDKHHGYVYRYFVQDVPDKDKIFVSMASVKGNNTSAFTEVFEVVAK